MTFQVYFYMEAKSFYIISYVLHLAVIMVIQCCVKIYVFLYNTINIMGNSNWYIFMY